MFTNDRVGADLAGMVKGDAGEAEQHQADQTDGGGDPVPLVELFQPKGFAFLVHGVARSFTTEAGMLMRTVIFNHGYLRKECNLRVLECGLFDKS